MKTTSLTALVAAAGVLMGGSAYAPANAADLGGGCCADLEARVAELEATTARKGNRVVSLQIYGQVNKALMYWDNDFDDDVYVVDNDWTTSRFGFTGTATMRPGWTAGYKMEFDLLADSNSNLVTEDNDEGAGADVRLRKNELWIESEQLGRFTIGQGSTATDGVGTIVLGNSYSDASVSGGASISTDAAGIFVLGEYADDLNVARTDRVRWDSPSIYGFLVSASWGEDDYWDVALRYKKEWNSIRIAAGIAYLNADEDHGLASDLGEFEQVLGSISVMHIPTGIYVALAAGQRDYDDVDLEGEFWYGQLGIEKRWLPYGSTTFYAEYGEYEDLFFDGLEANRWGFGVVQSIDSAAMDLYAQATFWDTEDDLDVISDGELTTVMAGAIIKF